MKKNLKKALKIANDLFPDHYDTNGNYRCYHFAFIFKRNKLISIGVNRPRKPDAKALYFGSKFNVHKFKKFNFLHAELDAIQRCWGKVHLNRSYCMVVIRLNKYGQLRNSKPCKNCQTILDAIGIHNVWWSTEKGINNE